MTILPDTPPAATTPSTSGHDYASYNSVAKTLHWLIAIAILGMLIMGWSFDSMANGPFKFKMYQLHKSVGITIMLLSLFRLGWRLTHSPPPFPDDMKLWERWVANAVHALLYVLMIGIPLVGWAMVSSSPMGLPTILYGVIPWPHLPVLPDLPDKGHYSHVFARLHGLLAFVLAGLFVAHAGAAWKHHLLNRDQVLLRMAPKFMHRILHFVRGDK